MAVSKIAVGVDQIECFDQTCRNWLELMRATKPVDRTEAEAAIKALYKQFNQPAPLVFWCASPWQMWIMPGIMQMMLTHSRLWDLREFVAKKSEEPWQAVWAAVNSQFTFKRYAHVRSFAARRQRDFSPYLEDVYKSLAARDPVNSFSPLAASPEIKFRGLLNACFDQDESPLIRHRFEAMFREGLNTTAGVQIAAELRGSPDYQIIAALTGVYTDDSVLGEEFFSENTSTTSEISNKHEWIEAVLQRLDPDSNNNRWWGPWSSVWLPIEDFALQNLDCRAPALAAELAIWCRLARAATAYTFCREICFVCERPISIHFDDRARLHNENGPSFKFADGFQLFSWHGTTVPQQVIEAPEKLVPVRIQSEPNAEIRRIMIERYGPGRFIADAGGRIIDRDRHGTLYRCLMNDDEPLVMVKVVNRTAEADGTFKEYFLRVPPEITTARAAVAWTFALDPEQYQPDLET
jgi:hypothetical protein